MSLTVKPLTLEWWAALEGLFGRAGASNGCWCMYWRIGPRYRDRPRADNRDDLRQLAASDQPPGLLALDGDLAVGWCELAPRADLAWLGHSGLAVSTAVARRCQWCSWSPWCESAPWDADPGGFGTADRRRNRGLEPPQTCARQEVPGNQGCGRRRCAGPGLPVVQYRGFPSTHRRITMPYHADVIGSLLRPIGANLISEDTQERKLELVAEVAHQVW